MLTSPYMGTGEQGASVNDSPGNPSLIVGIGASAGGIEAFRSFFEHMPGDTGMAFVVVLHLPAERRSLLPEIIGRWTTMPVVDVDQGCVVEPGHVYVPRPGTVVIFHGGRLHQHHPGPDEGRETTPIDIFFNSLATALGESAIGVVLSGTGSDGALGLKAIKERGGLTLAQGTIAGTTGGGTTGAGTPGAGTQGTEPMHAGMPDSAVATGAVDLVVPVEAMPGHIVAVQQARSAAHGQADLPEAERDQARLQICAALHRQVGHDFSQYKEKTFLRRVQRRMHVLNIRDLGGYASRLGRDRGEAVMLFRDLLIGVTSFFRDEDTFDLLKRDVIPRLFEGKRPDSTIRVWVAGCATGEEAYSLAMLLQEHIDSHPAPAPHVQVFATDIDDAAISTARAGRYPSVLLQGLSEERRRRFFVQGSEGSYTVAKDLRAVCTFSTHSLTRDPPFSRIDLVSCRNLLIYLDTDLQAAVIPAFHYSLVPDGVLLLGSSETVSRHEALFAPLDRAHRVFLRREGPSPPLQLSNRAKPRETLAALGGGTEPPAPPRRDLARISNRAGARVLERYGPAFVVVTAEGSIMQYSSRTGRFFEPVSGVPTQNALMLARTGLRMPLQSALKEAIETRRPVERPDVRVTGPVGAVSTVTLIVEPLHEQGSAPMYLVVFVDAVASDSSSRPDATPDTGGSASVTSALEAELAHVHEQVQAITEEHGAVVEELRSANEELHSVNEELQSTNEEVETSKEEIQSINEELHTANAQLSGNVDELDRRNTDLQNLFESTQVATIFLDPYLIIRGFTPAVADIYNLIPSDQGRPLTDIVSRLRYSGLPEDVRHVLTTLEPLERRVAREDGQRHYLMRILPYRTPKSMVDGTLVTFVDVTTIVQAEQHQRLLVDELNHRVKNMLTVVISMATQTMRRSQSMEAFSKDFMGRIHALTTAYSLLSNEGWQTVSLQSLLMEELAPFLDGSRANVHVSGPRVRLEPRAALALGMAIHELTTNAVKYGALSVPEGDISVTWDVSESGGRDGAEGPDAPALELRWVERGGPPVAPPVRRGFGMTLIERGLRQDMSAQVVLEFSPGGVVATLRAPLGSGDARPVVGPSAR